MTTEQTQYFPNESYTFDELKKARRSWASKLHPDHDKDGSEFKAMTKEFRERVCGIFKVEVDVIMKEQGEITEKLEAILRLIKQIKINDEPQELRMKTYGFYQAIQEVLEKNLGTEQTMASIKELESIAELQCSQKLLNQIQSNTRSNVLEIMFTNPFEMVLELTQWWMRMNPFLAPRSSH